MDNLLLTYNDFLHEEKKIKMRLVVRAYCFLSINSNELIADNTNYKQLALCS